VTGDFTANIISINDFRLVQYFAQCGCDVVAAIAEPTRYPAPRRIRVGGRTRARAWSDELGGRRLRGMSALRRR
jgi:hypothetical protein